MPDKDEWIDDTVAGALGSLIPGGGVASGLLKPLVAKVRDECSRSRHRVIRAIQSQTGATYEEIIESIEQDPALQPLFVRAMVAATQTGHHSILDALGASFGLAVQDRHRIDEAEILLIALKDLAAHHLTLLEILRDLVQESDDSPTRTLEAINGACDWTEGVTEMALQGLVNAGLVATRSGFGTLVYEITGFGWAALEVFGAMRPR